MYTQALAYHAYNYMASKYNALAATYSLYYYEILIF